MAHSKIVFYGTSAKGAAARYVSESIYRLGVQPEHVLDAPRVQYPAAQGDEAIIEPNTVDWHFRPTSVGEKKQYSITLTGDDPWYDSFIGAFGRIGSKSLNFDLGELDDIDSPARFSVNLFGGLDFTNLDVDGDGELEPDHHYKIYVNRDENPAAVFEGFIEATDQVQISEVLPAGILRDGDNQLEIEVIPDNGYNNDLIYLVEASLDVPTLNHVAGAYLQFTVPASDDFDSDLVMITDAGEQIEAVYSADANGNFAIHEFVRDASSNNILMRSPINSASREDALVWASSELGYMQVDDLYRAPLVDPEMLDLAEVDYVVVAAASLIGEDLARFVSRQQEMGRNTKVVNVQDVYGHYSSGRELPTAISKYLADQTQNSSYQYVLLVGGHTYNYKAYNVSEENAPINLIPAHYRPGDEQILQVPTAVPFVDFDNDGAPDRAIGRWPVRDLQQLKNVVDKTLAWHAEGSHADSKTALFVAGAAEKFNDFSSSFDRLLPFLGGDNDQWPTLNRVFMDDINADDSVAASSKVEFARNSLVDGLNQGAALTIFSGHASPSIWGRQSILNTEVAEMFSNQGQPSLMMPLACYASYYETPEIKSLAEQLFTDNANGAVGISSSAVLSTPGVAENMSRMLLNAMTVKGQDLGTAVLDAKRSLQSSSPEYQGFVHSWTTLADPTLSFKLPDISQAIAEEDESRPEL